MSLFFFAANDGTHGSELWSSDGTASAMVKDINPSGSGNPSRLTLFSDKLFFFRADDGTHGQELWSSDGTASGTVLVKDINPSGSGNPSGLTVFNGKLCFRSR